MVNWLRLVIYWLWFVVDRFRLMIDRFRFVVHWLWFMVDRLWSICWCWRMVWFFFWVMWSSLICDLSNISIVVVSSVLDMLDSTIRKLN